MDSRLSVRQFIYRPELGCLLLVLMFVFICMMPFLFLGLMQSALQKLHLSRGVSLLVMFGIFLGSMINIPIRRYQKETEQIIPVGRLRMLMGWVPVVERRRTETILALNVGGCLIPLALAAYQLLHLVGREPWVMQALVIAVAINVVVCWRVARPVHGVGIMMPVLTSPIVCVLVAWILLPAAHLGPSRAPVAFTAGVLGPLIGADLFHLRDFKKVSAGLISIGGAGTFDGIVLSGLLAALLA